MGVEWCDNVVYGATEDDLIKNALKHGEEHSGLTEEQLRTNEFVAYLKNAMKRSA